MKKVRIILCFSLVMLLFGCSQKLPSNEPMAITEVDYSETIVCTSSKYESLLKQNSSTVQTTHCEGIQTEKNVSTELSKKPTKNTTKAESSKYFSSGSSNDLFSYVKKGNIFCTDDKRFSAGQSDYHGIALTNYFLRGGDSVDKIVVNFTYGEKDWLLVSSKGVYGYNMVGGEIVVMNAPKETGFTGKEKYSVPLQNDWLQMQLEVFDDQNHSMLLTDFEKHWWANGYIQSDIKTPKEISVKNRIAFPDEEMVKLFVSELEKNDIKEVGSQNELSLKSYYIKDNEVYFAI